MNSSWCSAALTWLLPLQNIPEQITRWNAKFSSTALKSILKHSKFLSCQMALWLSRPTSMEYFEFTVPILKRHLATLRRKKRQHCIHFSTQWDYEIVGCMLKTLTDWKCSVRCQTSDVWRRTAFELRFLCSKLQNRLFKHFKTMSLHGGIDHKLYLNRKIVSKLPPTFEWLDWLDLFVLGRFVAMSIDMFAIYKKKFLTLWLGAQIRNNSTLPSL